MIHLTPITVALVFALTPAFAAADATATAIAPALTPTADARTLAATLVRLGDERENGAKALEPVEGMLSAQIAMRLSATDPDVVAKVKQVVHEALSPVVRKAGDGLVDGYAASFSPEELSHVVAFVESPEGQAEKANLPLLKKALAAWLSGSPEAANAGDTAAKVFAAASPETRSLVQRILAAQDFEARTRQGFATLNSAFESVFSRAGVGTSTAQPGSNADAKAADDYVRVVTEIEEGFYVTHYTDAQLTAVAAYLESEPGQAVLTRLPKLKRALNEELLQGLSHALSSLPERVCSTVPCSADQRTGLTDFTTTMAASVSRMPAFYGSPG
jgi:hypothetical protein